MTQFQHNIGRVWPQPEGNLVYVRQSFPSNGDFISTGQFDADCIGANGKGRTSANCQRVTSLFFDADCIGLFDGRRLAQGETLEPKVADRKAVLYALPPDEIREIKETVCEVVGEHLSAVMGADPTLLVDSGWGYHFHYAIEGFGPEHHAALKEFHIRVTQEINRRIRETMPTWDAALDSTNDVGARLARAPGSVNHKSGHPVPCEAISGDDTVIRVEHLRAIVERCAVPDASTARAPGRAAPSAPPRARWDHRNVDFSTMYLHTGETWQSVIDQMGPGDRVNTICPESGSSVGSAFFVVEGDGTSKLISNAANIVWRNTYVAPAPAGPAPRNPSQRATLSQRRDPQGNPVGPETTGSNLMRVLMDDGRLDLWLDSFANIPMNGAEPVRDTIYIDIRLMLERDYGWVRHQPGKDLIWDSILRVCEDRQRNPVAEYLRSLRWDGERRLDSWLHNTVVQPGIDAGVPPVNDAALLQAYSRKWAISLVARVLRPGCKVDTMLVLAGRQGFRKSQIFGVWGGKWFIDTEFDPANKDKYMVLARAWIYEDAELASGSRAQEESRKAFLTSQTDTYRSPYARTVTEQPRHFVVVGTTNDDGFLRDKTGSRRYWIVQASSDATKPDTDPTQPVADLDWLRANRDQLLAEAVAAYDAGEQWWLTADEDAARAGRNQQYVQTSVWDEAAARVFALNRGGEINAFTATEFAQAISPGMDVAQTAKLGRTLADALRAAGFCVLKGRHTRYFKAIPAGTTPMRGTGLHVGGISSGREDSLAE